MTEEQLKSLFVYIEHSDGTTEVKRGRIVEMAPGVQGFAFDVTHFSTFALLYSNEKEEVSLPKSIYFVVPSSKREKENQFDSSHEKRFKSVADAFLKECCNYVQKVDLCFISAANFINVLREDLLPTEMNQKIIEYFNNKYIQDLVFCSSKNKVFYYIFKDNITHYIITEIQWQRTKIWYDLSNIQKRYSLVTVDEADVLKFESVHHIPKIQIVTNKKSLENLINPKKVPYFGKSF